MRWQSEKCVIVLHCFVSTGSSTAVLERADVVDRIGTEARQDLQDFAVHHRPLERLRYSSLLLTLHTVFGIHCGQLSRLFCHQLPGFNSPSFGASPSDFSAFVRRELHDDLSLD